MSPPPALMLRRLQALARLKADAETARLAVTAQSRGRLRAALADLGRAEAPLSPPGVSVADQPAAPRTSADAPSTPGTASGDHARHSPPPCTDLILDPALVRARLAHGVWIGTQRAHLNARLAMVEADWRRLQPVAAKAFGRVQALEGLARRAEARTRRSHASRQEREASPPPSTPRSIGPDAEGP